jgi:amidase
MSDLHELSAFEQVRAMRDREICSRDLTEHYLDRIERLDPLLGSFLTVPHELARAEAKDADDRLARGDILPLLGLPLAIKDLHSTAGVRTTFGSAALAEHVPADDDWTVGRLRQAGVVLVGKTNVPEFGPTCFTENDLKAQPAVTPYDTTRYASGSSGGAAAAVAAGLLPVAHASDGAGSTRTPAATCHLVGVKPSRGLVSTAPVTSFLSAGTEGPLARSVRDAALLLDVMAQPWAGDLHGWKPATRFLDAIEQPPGRALRVAAWTGTGLEGVQPHPESVRAVERAMAALDGLGHDVWEIAVPSPCDQSVRSALRTWFAYSVGLTVPTLVPPTADRLLTAYTRHLIDQAQSLTAGDVVSAQAVLARYASSLLAALDNFDIALTPTTNGPPVALGHFTSEGVEQVADRMLAWSCYTPWVNLTGQPAISVPSHTDPHGLPYAIQLVGRPRRDTELLSLAAQLESIGLWNDIHPACWVQ